MTAGNLAASRVRTGGQDQRTTGRRQAGLNGVQDLDVRVGVGRVHVPEGQLVGDDRDVRWATQLAKRRWADLQGNAVGQLQRVCGSVRNQLLQDRTTFEQRLRIPYTVPPDTLREAVRRADVEALAKRRALGDARLIGNTLNDLGQIYFQLGRLDDAGNDRKAKDNNTLGFFIWTAI